MHQIQADRQFFAPPRRTSRQDLYCEK